MQRKWPALTTLLLGLAVTETVPAQCAMCKTALLTSPEGQALARGLNAGILLLLSAPFLLVGAVGMAIWIMQRRYGRSSVVDSVALPHDEGTAKQSPLTEKSRQPGRYAFLCKEGL
jgi:hypothetical protein